MVERDLPSEHSTMASTTPSVSFTEADTLRDDMYRTVTNWFDCLATELDSGDGHDRVASWLDVQARLPRETARNALLIALQQPEAERVAAERVWNDDYDREVCADAEPIWLFEPEFEPCCPGCDQAVADHDRSPCAYNGLDIEHWPRVVVGYTTFPV